MSSSGNPQTLPRYMIGKLLKTKDQKKREEQPQRKAHRTRGATIRPTADFSAEMMERRCTLSDLLTKEDNVQPKIFYPMKRA